MAGWIPPQPSHQYLTIGERQSEVPVSVEENDGLRALRALRELFKAEIEIEDDGEGGTTHWLQAEAAELAVMRWVGEHYTLTTEANRNNRGGPMTSNDVEENDGLREALEAAVADQGVPAKRVRDAERVCREWGVPKVEHFKAVKDAMNKVFVDVEAERDDAVATVAAQASEIERLRAVEKAARAVDEWKDRYECIQFGALMHHLRVALRESEPGQPED